MKLKLALRIAARHSRRDKTITEEQYLTVMDAIRHPVRKCKDGTTCNVIEKIEEHVSKEMGRDGLTINWDAVIQWVKDHWVQIVQLILSLSMLFIL